MALIRPGTWFAICAFQKPSRRSFLHVGFLGGLGTDARPVLPSDRPGGRAVLPAPQQGREGRLGHPHLPARRHGPPGDRSTPSRYAPIEYRGEMGIRPDQARRRVLQRAPAADRPDRRQDHRHPLDDARRGRPRARHAQHVHRLPAQPGPQFPSMGSVVCHEFGAQEQPAAVRLHPEHADQLTPAPATCQLAFAPFSLGSDPANGGFTVQDLNLPGGIDDDAVRHPAEHARGGQRPLRQQGEGRQHRGDGHVLPAGLQPDQLAEGHARRSTSTPSRPSSATSTAATPPASGC